MNFDKTKIISKLNAFLMKKNDPKKINICKLILILFGLGVVIYLTTKIQNCDCIFIGYIITFILQIIICSFLIIVFFPVCVEKKYGLRMAFVVNFLFLLATTLLTTKYLSLNIWYIHMLNYFSYILMLIILYNILNINNEQKLSFLKASNYILASIFTAYTFFPIDSFNNPIISFSLSKIENIIGYYYIVPLLILQGLYELLERKAINEKEDNKNA